MTRAPRPARRKAEPPLVPLRSLTNLRRVTPVDHRWVADLVWQPLALSEIHLTAHYLPLAIRPVRDQLLMGVLVGPGFVARKTVDSEGQWQAGPLPIAIRSFPFQSTGKGSDPLDDLVVPRALMMLSESGDGVLVDEDGQPTPLLKTLHGQCRQLLAARKALPAVLDQLAVADLLVPLTDLAESAGKTAFYTVGRERLAAVPPHVLAAMARTSFLSVDIAFACVFSQRHFQAGVVPTDRPAVRTGGGASSSSQPPSGLLDLFGPGDVMLDDGDLLSVHDLEAMQILGAESSSPT